MRNEKVQCRILEGCSGLSGDFLGAVSYSYISKHIYLQSVYVLK